jgi:hypothetical protein
LAAERPQKELRSSTEESIFDIVIAEQLGSSKLLNRLFSARRGTVLDIKEAIQR